MKKKFSKKIPFSTKNRKMSILKIFECEFWKIQIFSKSLFFQKFWFFENIISLKIFFLYDETIFFVRIFFCDQVRIYTNLRNHLEHLPYPHDDSEPPTRTQFLVKISQIPEIQLP